MTSLLDQKSLELAFQGRTDLQEAIQRAAVGPYVELFNQISLHILSLSPPSSEPNSKKRRLDQDLPTRPSSKGADSKLQNAPQNGSISSGSAAADSSDLVLLEIKDISLVIPQRKKYTLCFTSSHLYARLPDSKEPVPGISYAWKDIEYAFCLPVPDKSQKQSNYILFTKESIITPSKPTPGTPAPPEPIVFTILDSAPKPGTVSGIDSASASAVSDDYKTLLDWALLKHLKKSGSKVSKIVEADPNLFASTIKQPQRPKEKAVHVRGFRGSKDGYLFFLPNGILWGFKKPMLFLSHERISAVSYTSVLQRTFNLNVEVDITVQGGEETQQEFEFAMLDQEDFAEIDEFVKRHGLQDKSMAEQRKAKRLNVNVMKDENGEVVGTAESGELEKAAMEAEQAAVDEEDEDEEDYDPGSEGESEGSGSSSEDDDDDDDDVEGDGGGDDDEEEDGEEDNL